jgi:hypothetical protein
VSCVLYSIYNTAIHATEMHSYCDSTASASISRGAASGSISVHNTAATSAVCSQVMRSIQYCLDSAYCSSVGSSA